jgi:catechol 2,3-dioxygenase-like lactoylglutathione lyase family enzyme
MSAVRSIQTIAVYVTDLERSKRFYGDLLGLAQLEPPDRVAYRIGDSRLLLHPTDPGEGARHSRLELHLGVDDLDGFVARLAERATPVLQEPVDQPWGEREAIVLDPDGYPVFLVHQEPAGNEQTEQPADGPARDRETAGGISSATAPGGRRSAAVQVNCGGDVSVSFDESVPMDQVRSSHGSWLVHDDGHVTINGADEDIDVEINPGLELDLQVNAADATIHDLNSPLNAHLNVGDVTVNGRFDHGETRLYCNAGDVNVTLEPGSDVRVRVSPHARWQVHTDLVIADRGEWIQGNGTALLEIHGNFGDVNIDKA